MGARNVVERASVSSFWCFGSSGIYCLLLKFGLAAKLSDCPPWRSFGRSSVWTALLCLLADSRETGDIGPDFHMWLLLSSPGSLWCLGGVLHVTEMARIRKRWDHVLGKEAMPGNAGGCSSTVISQLGSSQDPYCSCWEAPLRPKTGRAGTSGDLEKWSLHSSVGGELQVSK